MVLPQKKKFKGEISTSQSGPASSLALSKYSATSEDISAVTIQELLPTSGRQRQVIQLTTSQCTNQHSPQLKMEFPNPKD